MKQLQEHYPKIVNEIGSIRENIRVEDFEPHLHHVLVEPLAPDAEIKGFIIPEQHRKKQLLGWVRQAHKLGIGTYMVGDLVLFASGAGTEVMFGEKAMLILQYHSQEESEILGRWPASLFEKKD